MQNQNPTLTYAEVRDWIVWLKAFTPSELASTMGVHPDAAMLFVRAAEFHGMVEDTGIELNGYGPPERLYRHKPLPPGPREHLTFTPEWRATPGCYDLAPRRGVPIRMVQVDRRRLSLPGESHRFKMRQKRWERMQDAVAKRKAAQIRRLQQND